MNYSGDLSPQPGEGKMSSFHDIFIRGRKGEKSFLNVLSLPLNIPAAASRVSMQWISHNQQVRELEYPISQT